MKGVCSTSITINGLFFLSSLLNIYLIKSIEYLSDICTSSTINIRGTLFFILDFNEPVLALPGSLNLEFKYFLYNFIISKKKISILFESFILCGPSNSLTIETLFFIIELFLNLYPSLLLIGLFSSFIFISFLPIDNIKFILLIFSLSKFKSSHIFIISLILFNFFRYKNIFLKIKQNVLYGNVAVKGSTIPHIINSF